MMVALIVVAVSAVVKRLGVLLCWWVGGDKLIWLALQLLQLLVLRGMELRLVVHLMSI